MKRERVDLHLHTNMSAMDGLSSAKELIRRVAALGHRAAAVTDHGVVQAFPRSNVVIDAGEFFSVKSFRQERLWYFEDDGEILRVYSGMSGLYRLLEFADNSWKDGRMRFEDNTRR